ncbi:unnamed protein product [Malus baccata var. baccata]
MTLKFGLGGKKATIKELPSGLGNITRQKNLFTGIPQYKQVASWNFKRRTVTKHEADARKLSITYRGRS